MINISTPCHASGELQSNTTPPSCLDLYGWQASYQMANAHRRLPTSDDLYWTEPQKAAGFQVKMPLDVWEEAASLATRPQFSDELRPPRQPSPHSFVAKHTHSCCISLRNIILNWAARRKGELVAAVCSIVWPPQRTLQMQMIFIKMQRQN